MFFAQMSVIHLGAQRTQFSPQTIQTKKMENTVGLEKTGLSGEIKYGKELMSHVKIVEKHLKRMDGAFLFII